jgi:hypothetical protein
MTITLTAEIEKGLVEQAGKAGTSPEELAIETLRQKFAPPPSSPEQFASEVSLAGFLGEFVGSIASEEHVPGGAQMSDNVGRRFAEGMLEKRRQGRL